MELRQGLVPAFSAILLAALLRLTPAAAGGGVNRARQTLLSPSTSVLPSWGGGDARHYWSLPGSTTASLPHAATGALPTGTRAASEPPLPLPSDVLRPPPHPAPSPVADNASADLRSTAAAHPREEDNEISAEGGYYYLPRATSSHVRPSGEGEGAPRGEAAAAGLPAGPRWGDARRKGRGEAGETSKTVGASRRSGSSLEVEEPIEEEGVTRKAPQSNPDIQDIISGIVRLLGGNVNVQANTGPPPPTTTTVPPASNPSTPAPGGMRPPPPPPQQSFDRHHIRINNRGPPRITDILFEEDSDGMRPPPPPRPNRVPPFVPLPPAMKPLATARPQGTIAVPVSNSGNSKPGPTRPPYPFERPLPASPGDRFQSNSQSPPAAKPANKPTRQMPRPFTTKQPDPTKITTIMKSTQTKPATSSKTTVAASRSSSRTQTARPKPSSSQTGSKSTAATGSSRPHQTSTKIMGHFVSKKTTATVSQRTSSAAVASSSKKTSSSASQGVTKPTASSSNRITKTTTSAITGATIGKSTSVLTDKLTSSSGIAVKDSTVKSSTTEITTIQSTESLGSQAVKASTTETGASTIAPTKSLVPLFEKNTLLHHSSLPSSSSQQIVTKPKGDDDSLHPVFHPSFTPALESSISSSANLESSMLESSISLTSVEGIASASSLLPTPPFTVPPVSISTSSESSTLSSGTSDYRLSPHLPRPGIVLDDTEYKPGIATEGDIVTAAPPHRVSGGHGEVFDVTVSAIQGPGGHTGRPFVYPVDVDGVRVATEGDDVITGDGNGHHDFVSIDGKRTYIDLFPTRTQANKGEKVVQTVGTALGFPQAPPKLHYGSNSESAGGLGEGTGYAVPEVSVNPQPSTDSKQKQQLTLVRRPSHRPNNPPVRIDTCIVGDPSTCDQSQHESCKTEQGVSSCHCRPGYARRKHREPCRRIISVLMAMKIGRVYDQSSPWKDDLLDANSDEYLKMEWEANKAIDSAMSMTPYSDDFLGSRVNSFKKTNGKDVIINATLEIVEGGGPLDGDRLQNHLIGVIRRRRNNVGDSALWVESPEGAIAPITDLDECSDPSLNDCSPNAECTNTFGSYRCKCKDGLRDPALPFGALGARESPLGPEEERRVGRRCDTCSAQVHCMARGTCSFEKTGEVTCVCAGNFYGAQCEVDGEVVGVAVGASVAALVIIILTLVCLCMWSRRWNRQDSQAQQEVQKKHQLAAMMASGGIRGIVGMGSPTSTLPSPRSMMGSPPPIFAYLPGGGGGGGMMGGHKGSPPPPTINGNGPSSLPPPAYYPLSSEDRMRWAQINEAVVSQQNHYAQPEPVPLPTRPSSAIFGPYGTGTIGSIATLQHHGTLGSMTALRHIPGGGNILGLSGGTGVFTTAPHLRPHQPIAPSSRSVFSYNGGGGSKGGHLESSEEDEDVVGEDHHKDLLGRSFHVPRPKSRSSIANQSGIYYDVDYEQSDPYGKIGSSTLPKQPPIPLSTYTPGPNRHYYK